MRILVSNLTSKIETDNPELLAALYKKYSFKVPGYQYTPQYKRKVWDGNAHYLSKNGVFRTGILYRILKDLELINCKPEIKNEIPKVETHKIKTVSGFTYLPYQELVINYILDNKRAIISSPVASGKTLMMAGVLKSLEGKKAVVMFREVGILMQTYEFFKSCGLKNLGINCGQGFEYGDVMLTTIQSIQHIIDSHLESAEVLIIDEAHQFCKGEVTLAGIQAFPNAIYRAAFTATVPDAKKDIHGRLNLEGAFGEVFHTMDIQDLIKDGILAKTKLYILSSGELTKPEDEDITYPESYNKFIINSEERNSKIERLVDKICKQTRDSKVLILVKNLDHLTILKDKLSKLNANVFSIEGKDKIADRYATIKSFLDSTLTSVIIGTNVMQTGININDITHMINARGMEGEIPTIQGLGRGLRTSKRKKELIFTDFYDDVPYLKNHSKSRIKIYEKHGFEIIYAKI